MQTVRNILARVGALPTPAKIVLLIAAPFVLLALILLLAVVAGLAVGLSPLLAILAFLALLVSIFALVVRALRGRPLRNWVIIGSASFVLLILFGGVAGALFAAAPAPPETPPEPVAEPEPVVAEATEPETTKVTPEDEPEATAEDTSPEIAAAASDPEKEATEDEPEYDETVRVTRVVDGDTVEISTAVDGIDTVRLIGVDTPETKEPGCKPQPYGPEADRFTTEELQGEEVGLEFDQDREDRYDRLLAYVYLEDDMFNETLLEEGYAQVYTVSPNNRYEDRFEAARDEAQEAERGIWGLSSAQQAQLTDRDNGIGGDGCEEEEPTPDIPEPEEEDEPTPTPDLVPAPTPPARPTPQNGADCKTSPKNVLVIPGSKGDGDGDGKACES